MRRLTNRVTETYVEFLRAEAHTVFSATLGEVQHVLADGQPRIVTRRDYTTASDEDVRLKGERLFEMARTTCERNDRARLLLLFRKTSHEWTSDLLRKLSGGHSTEADVVLVFEEGMLFGTNCILTFSRQRLPMGLNARFDFGPTPDELADAFRLALICFLHRQNVFFANSVARFALLEPAVSDALLASYNDRQQRMHSTRMTDEWRAILLPTLSRRFRRELIMNIPDGDGDEYEILLRHFVPVPTPIEMVSDSYAYLADKNGFQARLGAPFGSWVKVWVAINAVMCEHLGVFRDSHGSPETQHFTAIRLDEYGDSAMTGCPLDSLVPVVHAKVAVLFPDPPPLEECRSIISRLTYADTGFDDDVRFTEQPFIFYTFDGGLALWDGLRHHGLLRSIARTLSRDSSGADSQGRALESQIALAIRRHLDVEVATGIELKEGGRKVWEVDVTFLWQGVLFVVEAKHEIKNISYFFDAERSRNRVDSTRGHLDKQDDKLRSFGTLLRPRVDKRALTTGAITVVCSREVEFIPTFAREWWLTDTCPRVCRLDELLDALPQLDAGKLRTHPAFVAWT